MPKFLIIGDLHGKKPKIHFKDFDYIIAPGDFCSDKGIRPISNKWKRLLKKAKSKIRWDTFIKKTIGKRKLKALERQSLEVGREILRFLNSFNKPVFIVPGNWDQSYASTGIKDIDKSKYNYEKAFLDYYNSKRTNPFLTKGLKNIYDCQYRLYKFPEFNILGYGLSSGPENPKLREVLRRTKGIKEDINPNKRIRLVKAYREIHNKLDEEYKKRNKKNPTIFLTHNVPYNTSLDKVIAPGSYAHNKHYGSTVALEFCKEYQPLICIGGHIHEHFGKCKIGKTTAINAGFGSYVNVWMELEGEKIKKLRFYRGRKG